ncbi:alpha/beta fold hydrolase [Nonomuraea sp. NPDC004702]
MPTKRLLTVAATAAAGLGLASAVYQTWGSARDRRRYQPPGRLVDIGGRRIHLWAEGEGGPAVVIVPALGETTYDFAPLLPELARETTAVIFDRAGLGYSDPVWNPMALMDAADDLRQALHRAGIEPPFILVGHSIGGFIVRLFATSYPGEVAGIVLVDSSHPDQDRIPGYHWRTVKYGARRRLQWFGVRRLAVELGFKDLRSAWWPPEYVDAAVAQLLADRRRRTSWWEWALRAQLGAAVRRRTGPLGDIPLTVLTCSEVGPDATTPEEIAHRHKYFRDCTHCNRTWRRYPRTPRMWWPSGRATTSTTISRSSSWTRSSTWRVALEGKGHDVRRLAASIAVLVLPLAAQKCEAGKTGSASGLPDYGCVLTTDTPPTAFRPDSEGDAVWIKAVVKARCDVPPRSHHMTLTLQQRQASGWAKRQAEDYVTVPGGEGRLYALTYGNCEPGRWALRILVTGQDGKGREYRAEPVSESVRVDC